MLNKDSRMVELLLIVITLEEEGMSLRTFSAMRRLPSTSESLRTARRAGRLGRLPLSAAPTLATVAMAGCIVSNSAASSSGGRPSAIQSFAMPRAFSARSTAPEERSSRRSRRRRSSFSSSVMVRNKSPERRPMGSLALAKRGRKFRSRFGVATVRERFPL